MIKTHNRRIKRTFKGDREFCLQMFCYNVILCLVLIKKTYIKIIVKSILGVFNLFDLKQLGYIYIIFKNYIFVFFITFIFR